MKFTVHTLVAASTLALLTACGGDGDPAGGPTGSALAITSTNQSNVARATINGGLAVSSASGSVGGGSAASVADRSHAMGVALDHALHVVGARRARVASAGAHPAAVSTDTEPCADGGSISTSFDDKDGNRQLTGGDVITATFAQCRDDATTAIDGAIAITLSSTPTATQIVANAQFQHVSIAATGVTSVIDGLAGINETDTSTTSTTALNAGTGGLTVSVASSSYTDTLVFDAGTAFNTSFDETSGNSTSSLHGAFTSSLLAGHVTVDTPTALAQGAADPYPSSGVIHVVGASGSALLITVVSSSQVQLQLDANGDGTYESASNVAWSTLVP